MDDLLRNQMRTLYEQGAQGLFGENVKKATQHYAQVTEGPEQWIKLISDTYSKAATEDDELTAEVGRKFCEILIALYRETKKCDEALATAFVNAFVHDHPEVPNTVIFPRWEALARSQAAFSVKFTTQPLLLLEQLKKVILDYNNFFDRLSGYLLICTRCMYGKGYKVNTLANSYGAKLNELAQLTDGEDGLFYQLFRCAEPNIRNAIAHGEIWLDPESAQIYYNDAGQRGKISLMLLSAKVMFAVQMAKGYVAAVTAILILETCEDDVIKRLPQRIVRVFEYSSSAQ